VRESVAGTKCRFGAKAGGCWRREKKVRRFAVCAGRGLAALGLQAMWVTSAKTQETCSLGDARRHYTGVRCRMVVAYISLEVTGTADMIVTSNLW
jgi:hypothetical protein